MKVDTRLDSDRLCLSRVSTFHHFQRSSSWNVKRPDQTPISFETRHHIFVSLRDVEAEEKSSTAYVDHREADHKPKHKKEEQGERRVFCHHLPVYFLPTREKDELNCDCRKL
ncbi:hypothetical protein ACFE04_030494 [Oxalis oulophora]